MNKRKRIFNNNFSGTEKRRGRWPSEAREIFVISIRQQRRLDFISRAGAIKRHINAWIGVNGEHLTEQEIHKHNPELSRGKIGCFLSHRTIWRRMVSDKLQHALILEDDCIIVRLSHTARRIKQAIATLNKENIHWDVLLIGRNKKKRQDQKRIGAGLVRTGPFWGMYGYIIKQNAAQILLQQEGVKNFQVPCDVLLSNLNDTNQLKVFAVNPCIVTYDKGYVSDTANIK